MWVPNMGVYNQFLGASGPIKNFFGNFQEKIKCRNSAKNGRKCPKSKSPLIIFKYLFSLQISAHLAFKWPRKSKMSTFLPKSGRLPQKSEHFGFSRPFEGKMS